MQISLLVKSTCFGLKAAGTAGLLALLLGPASALAGPLGTNAALSGTYTVGTGGAYTTLTAAIAALNTNGVSGPVTFSLLNASYGSGETFPLTINTIAGASATNTVTIKPAAGVSPVVTNGTASALLKLNNAAYVVLDGSNAATGNTQNLTLVNTSATSTALVWIATAGGTASHDNQVLNTVLRGGSNASTTNSAGIMLSGTTYSSAGADNDNITISNNSIQGVYQGVACLGTAALSAGGLDKLVISHNVLGPDVLNATANLGLCGILVQGAVAPAITDNLVQNVVNSGTSIYGINLPANVAGGSVLRNTIRALDGGAGSGSYAFGLNSAATSLLATDNVINGITADNQRVYGAYLTGSANTFGSNTITNIVAATNGANAYGLYATGASLTASNNTVSNVSANDKYLLVYYSPYGMYLTGASSTVTGNTIANITSGATGGYAYGLYLDDGFRGTSTSPAVVDRNKVRMVQALNTSGYTGYGLYVATGGAAYLRVSNNFVADVRGTGYTGISSGSPVGVYIDGGQSGISLYHNSVSMSGSLNFNQASTSAALAVISGATGLDVRNNIFSNTLASNTANASTPYAFYSTAAKNAYTNINNNDYYVSTAGKLGYLGGDLATLAAVRTATGGDATSVSVVPTFTSTTDLHLTALLASGAGAGLATVPTDIDGDTRSSSAPTLGADELPIVDILPVALLTPALGTSCYSATEALTVAIRNNSFAPLDLGLHPVTVNVAVTGAATQTFTATLSSNPAGGTTLAVGAQATVLLPGSLSMAARGTYSFAITATAAGDQNTANNTLPTQIRTVSTPGAPTLSAAGAAICAGNSTVVTAASAALAATILAPATFDAGAEGFTTTSTGLQPASGFMRVPAGYVRGSSVPKAYNGPGGASTGYYYMADSDKFSSSAAAPSTRTTLVSPAFSTVGYSAAALSFQQYYLAFSGSDVFVGVEYTTDGSTWQALATYTGTTQGSENTVAPTTLALPVGKGYLQVRFRYETTDAWYWAIDNVGITGTPETPTYTVAPATGATVSGGTITFNPLATTTYQVTASYPSAATCPSAATPITITVNTSTTWTGAAGTDWFASGSWSNCVPTRYTDASIPAGLSNYPTLNTSAAAEVRTLALANGAKLSQSAGSLAIHADLTAGTAATNLNLTGGVVAFRGNAPLLTSNGPLTFYDLTLSLSSTTSVLTVGGNPPIVSHALMLSQGILDTGGNTLALSSTATIAETDASYVTGKVSTSRPLVPGSTQTFGGLGLTLTPATGSASPGQTALVRSTGTALTGPGTSQSIKRSFDIQPALNTGLNVTMTFAYFDHERNNIPAANAQLFKSVSGPAGPWLGQSPITIAGNTVTKTGITDFSLWTLGDAANPLPTQPASATMGSAVAAVPNPFGSSLRLLLHTSAANLTTELTLSDMLGRVVRRQTFSLMPGNSQLDINGLANLPAGVYMLRLPLDGQLHTIKLTKE